MHIEAICKPVKTASGAILPEYLVQVSHKEAMALGATNFEVGEELSFIPAMITLENHMASLRYAHRGLTHV